MKRLALLGTLAVLAAVPAAPAAADTLAVAAPGAVNLTAGGGYVAWAAPATAPETGWRLVVRAPDGTVTTPALRAFATPPRVSIGSDAFAEGRALLAVYSRPSGGDDDLYAYDLRAGTERRISAISSAAYDETVAGVQYGRFAFVRRGGTRPGVYVWTGKGPARRLTSYTPAEIAVSESRVAYGATSSVIVRRLSGDGGTLVIRTPSRPTSLMISRYRTTWLGTDGQPLRTPRYAGSGGPYPVTGVHRTVRPTAVMASAALTDEAGWYLGAEGVFRVAPKLTWTPAG
jgi:hypothetical protein